jgi:hypothetical protein
MWRCFNSEFNLRMHILSSRNEFRFYANFGTRHYEGMSKVHSAFIQLMDGPAFVHRCQFRRDPFVKGELIALGGEGASPEM